MIQSLYCSMLNCSFEICQLGFSLEQFGIRIGFGRILKGLNGFILSFSRFEISYLILELRYLIDLLYLKPMIKSCFFLSENILIYQVSKSCWDDLGRYHINCGQILLILISKHFHLFLPAKLLWHLYYS